MHRQINVKSDRLTYDVDVDVDVILQESNNNKKAAHNLQKSDVTVHLAVESDIGHIWHYDQIIFFCWLSSIFT